MSDYADDFASKQAKLVIVCIGGSSLGMPEPDGLAKSLRNAVLLHVGFLVCGVSKCMHCDAWIDAT
jgi:hypothetical protein